MASIASGFDPTEEGPGQEPSPTEEAPGMQVEPAEEVPVQEPAPTEAAPGPEPSTAEPCEEQDQQSSTVGEPDLEGAIIELLREGDLATLTPKIIRKKLEAQFSISLRPRKTEIREMVFHLLELEVKRRAGGGDEIKGSTITAVQSSEPQEEDQQPQASMPSDEELEQAIATLIRESDIADLSSKSIRKKLEAQFSQSLRSRKADIKRMAKRLVDQIHGDDGGAQAAGDKAAASGAGAGSADADRAESAKKARKKKKKKKKRRLKLRSVGSDEGEMETPSPSESRKRRRSLAPSDDSRAEADDNGPSEQQRALAKLRRLRERKLRKLAREIERRQALEEKKERAKTGEGKAAGSDSPADNKQDDGDQDAPASEPEEQTFPDADEEYQPGAGGEDDQSDENNNDDDEDYEERTPQPRRKKRRKRGNKPRRRHISDDDEGDQESSRQPKTPERDSKLQQPVQDLLRNFFDPSALEAAARKLGLAEERQLSAATTERVLEAYRALKTLGDGAEETTSEGGGGVVFGLLPKLREGFDGGARAIQGCVAVLQALSDIGDANKLASACREKRSHRARARRGGGRTHILDMIYRRLRCGVERLNTSSNMAMLMSRFVSQTQRLLTTGDTAETTPAARVEAVYELDDRHVMGFAGARDLPNQRLLCRAYPLSGGASLLAHGLRHAPREAPPAAAFGKGLVFSDSVRGALHELGARIPTEGALLVFARVALGSMVTVGSEGSVSFGSLSRPHHSAVQNGRYSPSYFAKPDGFLKGDTIQVPSGPLAEQLDVDKGAPECTRFVVFDPSQVLMKYIVVLGAGEVVSSPDSKAPMETIEASPRDADAVGESAGPEAGDKDGPAVTGSEAAVSPTPMVTDEDNTTLPVEPATVPVMLQTAQ